MTKKNENETELEVEERVETKPVTWRMPLWVAEAHAGDWSEFRDVLEKWVEEGEELEIPDIPEETTSVCLRMPVDILAVLDKEAKRLSKYTKRKWTAGKVARKIYEDRFEPAK